MPRTAEQILADLQTLDRENDRLEWRVALAQQSLKAAKAHEPVCPEATERYLQRAKAQLRVAG